MNELCTLLAALENNLSADLLTKYSGLSSSEAQTALILDGLIEEDTLLRQLIDVGYVSGAMELGELHVAEQIVAKIGIEYFQRSDTVPLHGSDDKLWLATSKPFDVDFLTEVTFLTGEPLVLLAMPSTRIRAKLASHQGQAPVDTTNALVKDQIHEATNETIRVVDGLFADALSSDASDIHLEPTSTALGVRLRVNGVLQRHDLPQSANRETIVARIKVLAGMNVSERRLPQDGRIVRHFGGRAVELRVSTLPTVHGEALVCRVLDPQALRLGWVKLGFDTKIEKQILKVLEQPSGLFVISGPTGSGKTTTLYTALNHLNDARRKIITVEDPVEYDLPGIEQVQVNLATGADFTTILRATLRHDPDVLMIGEIRDAETVQIACRAALIGRLVLATIHASSAHAVIERMKELGAPTALLDQVLLASLSQKLVPIDCSNCSGQGCDNCNDTGVSGRRLMAEIESNRFS